MELYVYQDTPPEKYYEAYITYHLVRYFEQVYSRRLYPFSISQIREKKLGFDFGYELSEGNLFLVQFKRPYVMGNGRIKWQIEKEQAEILAKQPAKVYYACRHFWMEKNGMKVWIKRSLFQLESYILGCAVRK